MARLALLFVACSLMSAIAASLLLGATFGFLARGPLGIPGGLLLGLMGLPYSLPLTLPSACLLGGLLWRCRVRQAAIWAAVGTLAGLGFYVLVSVIPGDLNEAMSLVVEKRHLVFGLACALAGAAAALLFRLQLRAFNAYSDAFVADFD